MSNSEDRPVPNTPQHRPPGQEQPALIGGIVYGLVLAIAAATVAVAVSFRTAFFSYWPTALIVMLVLVGVVFIVVGMTATLRGRRRSPGRPPAVDDSRS